MSEAYAYEASESVSLSDFQFEKKGTKRYITCQEAITSLEQPTGFFSNYDYKLTINGVEYEFSYWHTIEKLSTMGSFEGWIYGVTHSDTNIKEDKIVRFYIGSTCIFKGTITHAEFGTDGYAYIKGYDQAIVLSRRTTGSMAAARQEYTNTAANTVVAAICSGVMDVGTNANTSLITTRAEYDSRLAWLASIAQDLGVDWWISQDGSDIDHFNIGTAGSITSTITLTNSGTGVNCDIGTRDTDVEHIYNSVYVLGYGDGVNQIVGQASAFTTNITTLNGAHNNAVTTINVASTALFPASGSILIGKELITYSGKTGTSFTGCTRATSSTTATAHFDGQLIFDGTYSVAAPQTGSSIEEYGLIEKAFKDRSIISGITDPTDANYYPEATAQRIAERLLLKYYLPSDIIQYDFYATRQTLPAIGDVVTMNDPDNGFASSDYRCMGRERTIDPEQNQDDFLATVSMVPPSFYEDLQKLKLESDSLQQYAQGATNIYCIPSAENCDNTHPLYIRFFLPPETTFLNKVHVSFKLKDYRAYETGSSAQTTSDGSNYSAASWYAAALPFLYANFVNKTAGAALSTSAGAFHNNYSTTGVVGGLSVSSANRVSAVSYSETANYYFAMSSAGIYSCTPTGCGAVLYSTGWSSFTGALPYNVSITSASTVTGVSSSSTVYAITGVSTANALISASVNYGTFTHATYTNTGSGITGFITNVTVPAARNTFAAHSPVISIFNGASNGSSSRTFNWYLYVGLTTFASATQIASGSMTLSPWQQGTTQVADILVNYTNYKMWLQIKNDAGIFNITTEPDISSFTLNVYTLSSQSHSHSIIYGIYEEALSLPSVVVAAGTEGAESAVGTYTSDQTNIDITTAIPASPDNWYVVKFTPNKNMRIEANLFVQMFIQSKVS